MVFEPVDIDLEHEDLTHRERTIWNAGYQMGSDATAGHLTRVIGEALRSADYRDPYSLHHDVPSDYTRSDGSVGLEDDQERAEVETESMGRCESCAEVRAGRYCWRCGCALVDQRAEEIARREKLRRALLELRVESEAEAREREERVAAQDKAQAEWKERREKLRRQFFESLSEQNAAHDAADEPSLPM